MSSKRQNNMTNFIVDVQYKKILDSNGYSLPMILKKAKLPPDIFDFEPVTMKKNQYYSFCNALGEVLSDDALIKLATKESITTSSPPIFAASCSKDGLQCIRRLSTYKKLIGPVNWSISESDTEVSISLDCDENDILPMFFVKSEFLFLIELLRRSTLKDIIPKVIYMQKAKDDTLFSEYSKCNIISGADNAIVFIKSDLEKPFISENSSLFEYMEPELNKRLSDLELDESVSGKVRTVLSEILSGGNSSIDEVAKKLNISKRNLQRKLQEENTSFQKQLNSVRKSLAIHYIKNTNLSAEEIAFLLSYSEINSFQRAFKIWTGKTVLQYRQNL